MNRTNIEWTDFTWNPIVGCERGCWYCYAFRLARRFPDRFPLGFKPTFHPGRLWEPWDLKKPSKIFVCSMADLFARWTPIKWRNRVLESAERCPVSHTFQLLTKSPHMLPYKRKNAYDYPKNFWIGATVTNEDPAEWDRIGLIKKVVCGARFISFEPLLGALPRNISLKGLDWVIVGKLTGSKKVKLDPGWVDRILFECDRLGIPIFMKNNLKPDYGGELIQEFPE